MNKKQILNKQEIKGRIGLLEKQTNEYFDLMEKKLNEHFFKNMGWVFLDTIISIFILIALMILGGFINPILGYALGIIGFWYYLGNEIPFIKSKNNYNFYSWKSGELEIVKKYNILKNNLNGLQMLKYE